MARLSREQRNSIINREIENSKKRKDDRNLRAGKNLRIDERDILTTKAMVSILTALFSDLTEDWKRQFREDLVKQIGDKNTEDKAMEILEAIKTKAEEKADKTITADILEDREIGALIKELDPNKFEENMQALQIAIAKQGKITPSDFIDNVEKLDKKQETTKIQNNKDTNKLKKQRQ